TRSASPPDPPPTRDRSLCVLEPARSTLAPATTAAPEDRPRAGKQFDSPHAVLADQRALLRLAVANLSLSSGSLVETAAGALLFNARLARRSAASRLSSACLVETAAICAARRCAALGRWFVGFTKWSLADASWASHARHIAMPGGVATPR